MIDEPEPVDVELILAAGEYPQLTTELRERVLQAAECSLERRSLRRRVLRTACVLAVAVCMSGWLRLVTSPSSLAASPNHPESRDSTSDNVTAGEETEFSPALVAIGECEWGFVDAFCEVRRELSNPVDLLSTPALVKAIDSVGRIQHLQQQRLRRSL